jgi:hypothetical protein
MGLGSGIRKKTYSGSRMRVHGSKDNGSRIRNTAWHAFLYNVPYLYTDPAWIRI